MIRVLVVDDSITARNRITQILREIPEISVIAEAKDGAEAVSKTQMLRPDVILMDLVMPKMNGIQATERIMSTCPRPIIVISSIVNRKNTYDLWEAMAAGAVANMEKTEMDRNAARWKMELMCQIQAAVRIPWKSLKRNRFRDSASRKIVPDKQAIATTDYNLVALGVSTGGPGVLARILQFLPKTFPIPILVVIHISETQDTGFADWLNGTCKLDVRFASRGENINDLQGQVLIAPPSYHTVVKNGKIDLNSTPYVNYCRPSVDTLFFSLANEKHINPVGILLTGMGKDGAQGLKAIKETGGFTICQDESTSTVFGMPKAAIDIDATHTVLPDHQIAKKILSLVSTEIAKGQQQLETGWK